MTAIIIIQTETERHGAVKIVLSKLHEVSEVYSVSGEYDTLKKLSANDMEELNHVINSNIRWIGGVDDLTEMIVTERVKEEIVPQINSRGEIDALSVVEKDISIRDLIYSRMMLSAAKR